MKCKKYFYLADLIICIESDLQFGFPSKFKDFEVNSKDYDFLIKVFLDEEKTLTYDKNNEIYNENGIKIIENREEVLKLNHSITDNDYIYWYEKKFKGLLNQIELHFLNTYEEKDFLHFNILPFLNLSELLINSNSIILHSSFINYNNHGILFSAPSKTGKSTQADLWKKFKKAEIINGDRTIIKKANNEEYICFGSLYAGTSGIYKNQNVPLTTIVILRQAKQNKLRLLNKKEAYLCMISEMSMSKYDRHVITLQTDWLSNFVNEVPVFLLECLPNEEAVNILYNELGELLNER